VANRLQDGQLRSLPAPFLAFLRGLIPMGHPSLGASLTACGGRRATTATTMDMANQHPRTRRSATLQPAALGPRPTPAALNCTAGRGHPF
jgi:hypothetical protein